jgi:hypothetical protein
MTAWTTDHDDAKQQEAKRLGNHATRLTLVGQAGCKTRTDPGG